ncbi:MAG: NAD(P)-dependent dehydrogenase (short-subunit alcohol dehydrogenase family) [Bacteroidia bacterium]|jgi:NAD(P)-dependent dehydrogenase (short-subunit alcohol dehydrogenase family)
MSQFNAESTTRDVLEGVALGEGVVLVTGASSGLGVETSRSLASAGAKVVMLARDKTKLEAAAAELREELPGARLSTACVDLADLDSVRQTASDLLAEYPAIKLLINNAGVMACPLMRTAQGFEMQFGTNHLGHFLFTCLLEPALLAGAPGRVVNLSSGGHKFSNFNFDDPNYNDRDYEKWQAYGESKTANVLFSVALDKRLKDSNVRSFAVHPGVIMTELSRHMADSDFAALSERSPSAAKMVFKSVEQGAATSVWAATSAALAGKGGIYLEDCQIAAPAQPGGSNGIEAYAVDEAAAERLWSLSEELVGQTFNIGM